MRNKGMCDNVVNRARVAEAKKVVVIVGASHKKYMQDIFKTMPDVRVRNINEFK
jgi:pheromone shutdown protein TraB